MPLTIVLEISEVALLGISVMYWVQKNQTIIGLFIGIDKRLKTWQRS